MDWKNDDFKSFMFFNVKHDIMTSNKNIFKDTSIKKTGTNLVVKVPNKILYTL